LLGERIRKGEQNHYRAASANTRATRWINFFAFLTSLSAGILSWSFHPWSDRWFSLLSISVAGLTASAIFFRFTERSRKEQKAADDLRVIRMELETLSERPIDEGLEDRYVDESVIRLKRLLVGATQSKTPMSAQKH
jgi:hypothetical protein